ncbi:AT-rich interactive domain-containing protein 5B-like [Bacillus rossius redtenbacheri]|uniref:AT-rich interactive domain-containing protein 5B-like n=1 Tax=Bacillus rossius redtenbacheri TaxID=93214 RepID=UPI002FDD20E1
MDNNKIQLIGAPCGHHGQYTFYKAFKYHKNGKLKILALSDFFFVKLWSDSDLISIGELQLLWIDKNSDQVLASLRLYFLPENTPEGRNDDHGEDEVLAISEKVVLRVEDLLSRLVERAGWGRGLQAVCERDCPAAEGPAAGPAPDSALRFQDVLDEKAQVENGVDDDHPGASVVVLSFPRYCRYRGILKRLEGVADKWLRNTFVAALGGFAVPRRNTHVLFCKDTFDYPDLEGHELLCNHLAPNLKGRPRRKRKKRSLSPGGSESNESESSFSTVSSSLKVRTTAPGNTGGGRNGLRCNVQPRRSSRVVVGHEEREFLVKLHAFMRTRRTPIDRVPHLGFKEIDLFAFYTKVQKLGGYNVVTANRMWKPIYDDLGGHQGSTSAATCTRRHYEKLLLPYETSIKDKTSKSSSEKRSAKFRSSSLPDKDSEDKSDSSSSSPPTTTIKTESKVVTNGCPSKEAGKTSSLRSIRPKAEKLEKLAAQELANCSVPKDKENIPVSNVSGRSAGDAAQDVVVPEAAAVAKPLPEPISPVTEQDLPLRVPQPPVPLFKKRKLEILKEGGLEVTAVAATATVGTVTISAERRPSVIRHAMPEPQQVSITVTPDVGLVLAGRQPRAPAGQSRSMFARSQATVYGNPKDVLFLGPSVRPSSHLVPPALSADVDVEVLDLRVRCADKPNVTICRVPDMFVPHSMNNTSVTSTTTTYTNPNHNHNHNHTVKNSVRNNGAALPIMDGKAMVSPNLEITVVDVPRVVGTTVPQRFRPVHEEKVSQQRKSLPSKFANRGTARNENGRSRNYAELIIPNPFPGERRNVDSSPGRFAQLPACRGSVPTGFVVGTPPGLPGYTGDTFLPLVDPMYFSLYDSRRMYPQQVFAPSPVFEPSPEHLQLYKELMSAHGGLRFSHHPSIGSILGLPRDGSVSITPVDRSPPPSSK